MIDARTEKNLATLDSKAAGKFRPFIVEAQALAATMGFLYVAISGNRTWKEQDALYAQGRTAPGKIVTKAKGGQSNHNFGIALDFGVFQDGKYLDDGTAAEQRTASSFHRRVSVLAGKHGLEWGGAWTTIKDEPHFEVKTGLTLAEKRARYQARGTVFS